MWKKDFKYSDEDLKKYYLELNNILNKPPSWTELDHYHKQNKDFPIAQTFIKRFGSLENLAKILGLDTCKIGLKYTKEFLIKEIKRFVNEFNRIPIPTDFDKIEEYPSRKTFTKYFPNFNDLIREAGYKPVGFTFKDIEERYNKDYLLDLIYKYRDKYNKVPTMLELSKEVGYEVNHYYFKVFGSWTYGLKEAGLPLNSISHHDDKFLEQEFHRFVKENGRIPRYKEFNNSSYPSFWCYQNRFGSWNKAVVAYGYKPNDENRKITLDNGEICASSYEFDVSNWLIKNNIEYIRDINYKDFIAKYKGKMNCDYVIYTKDKIWYVEVAGFLKNRDFTKYSSEEKKYYFKLRYKKKMLKENNLNYKILYPSHLEKPFNEVFSFLFNL